MSLASVLRALKWPFNSEGRIGRAEFVLALFCWLLTYASLLGLLRRANASLDNSATLVLCGVFIVLFFFGANALSRKRRQDLGRKPGFTLNPLSDLAVVFKRGTPGENAYGEKPPRWRVLVFLGVLVACWFAAIKAGPPPGL